MNSHVNGFTSVTNMPLIAVIFREVLLKIARTGALKKAPMFHNVVMHLLLYLMENHRQTSMLIPGLAACAWSSGVIQHSDYS